MDFHTNHNEADDESKNDHCYSKLVQLSKVNPKLSKYQQICKLAEADFNASDWLMFYAISPFAMKDRLERNDFKYAEFSKSPSMDKIMGKTFVICFATAILEFVQNSRKSSMEGVEKTLNRLDEIIKTNFTKEKVMMGPFKSMSRTIVKITQNYLDLWRGDANFFVNDFVDRVSKHKPGDGYNGSVENVSGALDFYSHKLQSSSIGSNDDHWIHKLKVKDSARWKVYVNPEEFPLDAAQWKSEKMHKFPVENSHYKHDRVKAAAKDPFGFTEIPSGFSRFEKFLKEVNLNNQHALVYCNSWRGHAEMECAVKLKQLKLESGGKLPTLFINLKWDPETPASHALPVPIEIQISEEKNLRSHLEYEIERLNQSIQD
jgi:hypothetical protein